MKSKTSKRTVGQYLRKEMPEAFTPWRKASEPPGDSRNVIARMACNFSIPKTDTFITAQYRGNKNGWEVPRRFVGWKLTHWMDIPEIPKDL